jgi:hypothetical protein
MSIIEQFLAETRERLAELAPVLEGLRDFRRAYTPEEPDAIRKFLDQSIEIAHRRWVILSSVESQLIRLLEDGYPEKVSFDVVPELADYFLSQVAAAQSAYNSLRPKSETVSADVVLGTPIPRT